MSTLLQIRYVRIRTDDGWQEPYDLDAPVVAIVGPVDSGKSSLLDCIAFALGRDTEEFRGAVHRFLREVEVGIRVSSGRYILTRTRKASSHVTVFDAAGTLTGRFPVRDPGDIKGSRGAANAFQLAAGAARA
jgi:energy-coupling factor transporter ATP-binding protein EcfA2